MNERITLAHGAGGAAMMKLISDLALKEITLRRAGPIGLDELDDGATFISGEQSLVMTTDSHTVKPLFFPGGDIGRLAVSGTVNDLSVMGAKPIAMACAFVIEEGFLIEDLRRVFKSMDETSREVMVPLITGDTKVMERKALDGLVVTTTGVGVAQKVVTDRGLKPNDKIIVTGTIGDHGMTILTSREGIQIDSSLCSDVAPIWQTIEAALKVGGVTAMKDPTRGGIAGVLNEMASKSRVGILIREADIPIKPAVRAASEMLGIDPLQITNEGKAVIGVNPDYCDDVLEAIRKTKYGKEACVIGEAISDHIGGVLLETVVGGRRLVDVPAGDPVPRIC
jgi:hydrogenase expression/formation protein HypE